MSEVLGMELGLPARFIVAFVLVLALIGLTAWLIRQFGGARASSAGGGRNRVPRLAVLDSAIVDARRRLVLIRRDNVEHLILIGGPTDVVVEENIVRAQPAAAAPAPAPRQSPPPRTIEIEPEFDPTLVPYDEGFEEPLPPPPPPAARPAQPRASARANVEPPRPAARPTATRQDQYDDVTKRLEAALRQPAAENALARAKTEPRVAPPAAPRPANETRPTPTAAPAAPAQASNPPAPAAPAPKSGADVFSSLEEEMASLLRPGDRKNP